MKKIFIYVEACETRLLDGTRLYKYFKENGYEIVYEPEDADIIIFITCSFGNILVDHQIVKIKEFQKYDSELIISGCLPAVKKEELAKIFDGKVLITKDIEKIDDLFPDNKIKFNEIDDANVPLELIFGSREFYRNKLIENIKTKMRKIKGIEKFYLKTYKKFWIHIYNNLFDWVPIISRFYIFEPYFVVRISRGCFKKQPCSSYLDVSKAVGPLKSKSIDQCVKEFKKGLKEGYKLFIINGDDPGAYGLDINSNYPELIKKIQEIPGDYEIEIENLTQYWLVKYIDELEEIVKKQKISRIGVLIESGSSRIVELMGRYSDIQKTKEALLRLKKADPKLKLFTHFVVGFPTETEEEFQETLDLIRDVGFDTGYIYKISYEFKTDVDHLEPKISEAEISKRLNHAKKFLEKLGYHVAFSRCFKGIMFNKRK